MSQQKKYRQTKEAITEAIRICKDRNVLKEYLESKEQEVVDIMMALFDDEWVLEAYAEAYAKEREDNRERATARETAKRMIKKGKMPLADIAEYVPSLSFDELRKLEAEIMQPA